DIRTNAKALTTNDLDRRQWHYETSGGSTGEPLRLIQDIDFSAVTMATMILNFEWLGRQIGESALWIWGSERDVLEGSVGLRRAVLNFLANDEWLNAFQMSPERMRETLRRL